MQFPNSQPDDLVDNNNHTLIKKKNNDHKDDGNPSIVSPLQSEKVRIIIKSPTLKDKESIKSKVEEVFESVKENTSNIINKAIKVEEQDINSFKRFSEKVSQTQQQQTESLEEEFVIPVIAEEYSLSKKNLSEEINIEKRWVEQEEIKIPVRYEKVFVNDKEIDVYSKQGVISQIKEKISDLVQSNNEVNETMNEEKIDTKNQKDNKEIEKKKRGEDVEEEELQVKGEIVPLFDNQQNEDNNIHYSNNKELAKKEHQSVIPLYAEEITISKKIVKVGEILLSKRRVIEEENVNVDTIKERISLEHPYGRKQKLTGY
jgi:hypothetical protein